MQENHRFSTAETSLAVYLIIEGFELLRIDYSEPRYKYIFAENTNKDINFYTVQYMSSKASVDPVVYSATNKKLLRIIKRQIQWGEDFNG